MDLSWLTAPVSKESFVSQYWGKAPLRIARDQVSYYSDLFPEVDLEFALYAASGIRNGVDILSEDDQLIRCRTHGHAIEAFRQGRSLRIDSVQRFSRLLNLLCRNLAQLINCTINVNMYLTPGAGKKALKRHYDTHDVFVLQTHGNKRWRLYGPPSLSPLEYLPLQRRESMREMQQYRLDKDMSGRDKCILTEEFTLKTGDCLYLPRGFWHEAESEPGEISCHLTVGVQPATYLDILNVAIGQVALSDVRLREPLPFGFATDSAANHQVAAQMSKIGDDLVKNLDARYALGEVSAHFLRKHSSNLENNLLRWSDREPADGLTSNSRVRIRRGTVCVVNSGVSSAQMIFGTQTFAITPAYEESCRFISTAESFTVGELPGDIGFSEKVTLVQQLIIAGLLVPANGIKCLDEMPTKDHHWFPIQLDRQRQTIKWFDAGLRPLKEPFLHQTFAEMQKEYSTLKIRTTNFYVLEKVNEEVSPSGFIFHISRCGSTLLSNGLRAIPHTVVISEPQPISEALVNSSLPLPFTDRTDGVFTNDTDDLLRGLIRAYGQRRTGDERALLFKFSSWNILHIATFRRLWPHVPCIIVVRHPTEVAVSCLEQRPGWMRWKDHPKVMKSYVGWENQVPSTISDESFCAKMLGEFLKCAATSVDKRCQIIDYQDLNCDRIEEAGRFFGLAVTPADGEMIEKSLSIYSKDRRGKRQYLGNDSSEKQARASRSLQDAIRDWAQETYDAAILASSNV